MKKLSWAAVIATFLLMVWGNLVSATGSGLACPDWPTCHGTFFPPVRMDIVLEWGHRILAAVGGSLILLTCLQVFLKSRSHEQYKKTAKIILGLLAIQIPLGGITVLLKLSAVVSTIHLINAHVVFAGILSIAIYATWGANPTFNGLPKKFTRLAWVGALGLLIQIFMGGILRHAHFGMACPGFPSCHEDSFFPMTGHAGWLSFLHRWWGIALIGIFTHLLILTRKAKSEVAALCATLLGLSLAQIIFGIATVTSGLGVWQRALHGATGYLLWGIVIYLALRSPRNAKNESS